MWALWFGLALIPVGRSSLAANQECCRESTTTVGDDLEINFSASFISYSHCTSAAASSPSFPCRSRMDCRKVLWPPTHTDRKRFLKYVWLDGMHLKWQKWCRNGVPFIQEHTSQSSSFTLFVLIVSPVMINFTGKGVAKKKMNIFSMIGIVKCVVSGSLHNYCQFRLLP